MSLKRREFLKLLLAGAGAAALPGLLEACGGSPTAAPATPTPELLLTRAAATVASSPPGVLTQTAPAAGATPAAPGPAATMPGGGAAPAGTTRPLPQYAASNPKRLWAWLRMLAVDQIPTSEAAYRAHRDQIDTVMPLNGGVLQADGTWAQEDHKLSDDWPQGLPKLARDAGQLYMPGMGNDRAGILKVLASTSLQERAAADLVKLAKSGRFDSPWDGIYLDLEGVSYTYRTQMSGFLFRLGRAVSDAGLLLGVSVGAVTESATGTLSGDDANDLGVAGEVGDFVDLRCYDYGGPLPQSIAPYWWIEASIQYALKKGVKPGQMTVGLANFSQYWPQSDQRDSEQTTYDRAMQLVKQSNAQVQWVESDENGPVRQSYARIGAGHLSITDERTYGYGLGLADQYGLLGNTMFAVGMGSEAQWQAIAEWEAKRKGS